MIIKVKNKRNLCIGLVVIILFLDNLTAKGFLQEIDPISELTLFLTFLWILSLFIKLEVKK